MFYIECYNLSTSLQVSRNVCQNQRNLTCVDRSCAATRFRLVAISLNDFFKSHFISIRSNFSESMLTESASMRSKVPEASHYLNFIGSIHAKKRDIIEDKSQGGLKKMPFVWSVLRACSGLLNNINWSLRCSLCNVKG